LVARQDQLDELPAEALEAWSEVLVLADTAIDEEEDDGPSRPSGLHAKLLAIEHGWDVTWWVGSANLSHAAWHGSNVEVMAEVTGRKSGQSGEGISRFFESGFRNLCQPYRHVDPVTESEKVIAARKALRAAREELVDADLRDMHQRFQLGILGQIDFFNMAFPILCGVDTVYAHRDSFSPDVYIRSLQLSRLASSAA